MEHTLSRLPNRMFTPTWQKAENQIFPERRKKNICVRSQKRILGSSLEELRFCCKMIKKKKNKPRTEIVQFDLVMSCLLLTME